MLRPSHAPWVDHQSNTSPQHQLTKDTATGVAFQFCTTTPGDEKFGDDPHSSCVGILVACKLSRAEQQGYEWKTNSGTCFCIQGVLKAWCRILQPLSHNLIPETQKK
jgi:hypothetical protein